MTRRWGPLDVAAAAAALVAGEVVGFPTETVYGAGANALSDVAVKRIFDAKGRPSDNPLIVHVAGLDAARKLVRIDTAALEHDFIRLADAFWPGPLTIILPFKAPVSPLVTAGLQTVGVRIPDHPLALALLDACGLPIAAPSANLSGKPSPTTAAHVHADLGGRIGGVIDGGCTGIGLESTVIDCSREPYTVLRPGAVTLDHLQALLGDDHVRLSRVDGDHSCIPRAPGIKYQHYAPSAPLYYIKGDLAALQSRAHHEVALGHRVGVLVPGQTQRAVDDNLPMKLVVCGDVADVGSIARNLYACLRWFDDDRADPVDVILAHGFPGHGIGVAIMNRILKASTCIIE